MIWALVALAGALAASAWTTAYAITDAIPSLLWLDHVRRTDAWWDTIEAMHETLANWQNLEAVAAWTASRP